ncbi:lipoprotein YdaJ [Bacillus atrophaeus]|uniref:lipoprotein YdaJ n=1 Tax=Bacillus atrophaeus TaxID=1452 RepID=UPI002DBE6E2D|nr:lipoprotein YdaJ [Bacillus atrophaeus]MEC1900083.1 lipoprotein YdaJ [Bacillus atrophaeus]MEC2397075.1 lipoprotein YdaJ [Bacillus atrophaeus]MED4436060.1 lipoprotein YdaJ [Bacillus atrophaeus]MED4565582.1 lipoprotein YdaJ [Bacillus atrophaeus]MED4575559.1 lipoprotein YdaJ [Bacillus atrophaeus]
MKNVSIFVMILLISIGLSAGCMKADHKESADVPNSVPLQPAEHFVYQNLMNEKGWIQTNLKDHPAYLSESLGLWMEFLLSKKDASHFQEQYQHLAESFLMKNNLITWKIEDNIPAKSNALIDDLRIMLCLDQAAALWNHNEYAQTARQIGAALKKHNMNNGVFTDFYDSGSQAAGKDVTLSYIMPDALAVLKKNGLIDEETEQRNLNVLYHAPLKNGFLPKTYNTETGEYKYDSEVNVIDQLYAALHLKKGDEKAAAVANWVKQEFEANGKLYGRYSAETKKPAVQYESPSVYALAILFLAEQKEDTAVIKALYEKMTGFEIFDPLKTHYGGYMSGNDTHSFDNLLPLLAERKLFNENIIQ